MKMMSKNSMGIAGLYSTGAGVPASARRPSNVERSLQLGVEVGLALQHRVEALDRGDADPRDGIDLVRLEVLDVVKLR